VRVVHHTLALSPGTQLGPYEIVAPLGAGAMGEVYRARDIRLDRRVAVKVLPAEFASHAEWRARFEREAKTISSLSHPHICTLYDVGDNYIVMELLEGETLEQRLQTGSLTIEQVVRIGINVADALDKAHRHGIVHRDLKPANVMLTRSGAKLLDFGLAKSTRPIVQHADGRTMTRALTAEGTIVGTFHYMPPEQVEGREADARSDIFAFGAILYEMLTGRRAFAGDTGASVIAAILASEPPPISEQRPTTPPALDRLVRTCLAKDPDDRWQTAHDVMLQMRGILESGSTASGATAAPVRRLRREHLAWSVAAVALLVAIGLGVAQQRGTASSSPLVHFAIETPPNTSLYPFDTKGIALSPDGTRIAFVAEDSHSGASLYVRDLATTQIRALAGTEDASYPFWSPDGTQLGFFANQKLHRLDLIGGPIVTLCEAASGRGGSWNRDGVIVFAPTLASRLYRISAGGGRPEVATPLEADGIRARWPWFLPDGNRFLYIASSDLVVGSLDGKLRKVILSDVSNAVFAPPDRVVFSRGTVLMSQRFDPDALSLSGEAVPLPFGKVSYMSSKALSIVSASLNGTLAYLPGTDTGNAARLVWVDARGREDAELGDPGGYTDAALSPDGKHVAVVRTMEDGNDLWLLDTADGRLSRFTFHPGSYGFPHWSGDSQQVAYFREFDGVGQVCIKSLDGVERCPVLPARQWQIPYGFSPDGMTVLTWLQTATAGGDIYTMSLGPKPTLTSLVTTSFDERSPSFSPDGKWIAYQSNASMRAEVYVRRYPPTPEQWQISTSGGESPIWSPDGKDIFYGSGDTIMRVPFDAGATPGKPAPLFHIPGHRTPRLSGVLSRPVLSGINADGQRFLLLLGTDQPLPTINVVLNWRSALPR
jgi:Tol biopolymer transport system component/predicted Ser/Thr protein kinase